MHTLANFAVLAAAALRSASFAAIVLIGLLGFSPAAHAQISALVAQSAQAAQGAPICGGVVNGKLQMDGCPAKPARFVSDVQYTCPAGSFFDANGNCYQCPAGYKRSAEPVTSDRACDKADSSVRGSFMPARFAGALCKGGFFDSVRGGECWSCPQGYQRSAAPVGSPNACIVPAGESWSGAQRHSKGLLLPHEFNRCNRSDGRGGFYDVWDGGGCWSCPAGYQRSGYAIWDGNGRQCYQAYGERQSPATVQGKAQCGPGEFQDPRKGGECWSCPTATTRTVFPVDTPQACEKWGGYVYAPAKQMSSNTLSCAAGQIYDTEPSRSPGIQNRVRQQAQEERKPMPVIGNSAGGTCWTCPPGYARSTAAVWEANACQATFLWKSPAYRQPGLFGLDGGEETALALIQDRKLVDAIADGLVPEQAPNTTESRRRVWDEIARTPHNSAALRLAALSRIQVAAIRPAEASEAERRLAASFAKAVRDFNTFMAQDALNAYDAWSVSNEHQRAQRSRSSTGGANLTMLVDAGATPPDFEQIQKDTILASLGTGAGLSIAGATALVVSKDVALAVFPYMARGAGGAAAMSGGVSLGAAAGPAAIATVAIQMAVMAIIQAEQMANARPRLLANLATAQQHVDLPRLVATEAGIKELRNHWLVAMAGETPARQPAAFAAAAKAATAAAPAQPAQAALATAGSWQQMPGLAQDIGISGAGLWHVGTNRVPGGYGLWRWDGAAWQQMPGGAVRVDADFRGNAVTVNEAGEIHQWQGQGWTKLPGLARDVGVGANGSLWVVGTNAVPGGFGVWRWDGKAAWQAVPGGGVRIDVDPQGNAWLVNDANQIWRWDGSRFVQVPGAARDVGIGADGSVFVVGPDDTVHKWNGGGWSKRDGLLRAITVGADGTPFGVSADRKIWAGGR